MPDSYVDFTFTANGKIIDGIHSLISSLFILIFVEMSHRINISASKFQIKFVTDNKDNQASVFQSEIHSHRAGAMSEASNTVPSNYTDASQPVTLTPIQLTTRESVQPALSVSDIDKQSQVQPELLDADVITPDVHMHQISSSTAPSIKSPGMVEMNNSLTKLRYYGTAIVGDLFKVVLEVNNIDVLNQLQLIAKNKNEELIGIIRSILRCAFFPHIFRIESDERISKRDDGVYSSLNFRHYYSNE